MRYVPRDSLVHGWRVLVFAALMFWQGGFFFYTSAVVPTAAEQITHREQGFITRKVAVWINNAALVSLALLAVDAAFWPDPRPWRRRIVWGAWLAMALLQVAILLMYRSLDVLLDPDDHSVGRGFRLRHSAYVWMHTVQAFAAIAYLYMLVATWRRRDRTSASREI